MSMKFNKDSSVSQFIKDSQKRVNETLNQAIENVGGSETLSRSMRYACIDAGKRIRPTLTYGSALSVGGSFPSADIPAAAVELIHCYSLTHDDLPSMDDDDLRRGKPSVHKAFDEATAILVGDALQSLAFELLSSSDSPLNPKTQLKMLQTLAKAAGYRGMAAGQAIDFNAKGKILSVVELEKMHKLKTGALIKAAVRLGALSHPGVKKTELDALEMYATKIGLAFQVRDDILDEISATDVLGKPQGSDQAHGKPTYLSRAGLEAARTKTVILANEAISALANFSASADPLRELAEYVVRRDH
jgi:geranylgeranyl diphosphate synthase type II